MFKKITAVFFSVIIFLLVAVLITLKMAPAIAVHYASQWYAEQGEGYRLEVRDWQFLLLKAQIELNDVVLYHPHSGAEKTALKKVFVDVGLKDLVQQKITLQKIELEGLRLDLAIEQLPSHQDIELAGLKLPIEGSSKPEAASEEAEFNPEQMSWPIALQRLVFTDLQVQWQVKIDQLTTDGAATLQRLTISEFSTADSSQPKIDLALRVTTFNLNEPQLTLLEPVQLKAQGKLTTIFSNPTWLGDIELKNIKLAQDEIQADVDAVVLTGVQANATHQQLAQLTVQQVQLAMNELAASVEQVSVKDVSASNGKTLEAAMANLEVTNVSVQMGEQSAAIESIALANFELDGDQQSIQEIVVEAISAADASQNMQATLAKVELDKVFNQGQQQTLQNLQLHQLQLTGADKELVSLEHYQLAELTLAQAEQQLTINLGKHQFSGLLVDIERNKQGVLVGLPEAQEQPQTEPEVAADNTATLSPESTAAAQALAIALVSFLQHNTEDSAVSTIKFNDFSIQPNLKAQVKLKKIEIGQGEALLANDAVLLEQAVPILLELGIGEFSTTEVQANLSLYQADGAVYPEGTIKLKTRKLDIVDFNGYIIQALGYQLDRGSLDIDADISIHETVLKGEIKLLLRNSKFTPADEETINRVSKQISMPLDTAIGLLRDKNGNVNLNIPVEGRLDDPDFGINDITKQLSNKAFKATAVFLLKQSMQPYGTMLTVASFAGDYLFAIRLDALQFVNNEKELTDDHKANLTKVGELMQSKKKIEVRACPFVNEEEAAELGEQWEDLAKARGQAIKQWFESNFSQESERLTLCRAQKGKAAEVVLGVN